MEKSGWTRPEARAMTLRNILIDISLAMLMASPAGARPSANPPGRLVLGPDGPRAAGPEIARGALPAAAQTVVPVPLPAGAVQLDSTWYDLQDMGSLGHHIEVGTDGRVHATWQDEFCELGGGCPPNLAAPQPHPNRGMGYAVRDVNGTWSNLGKITDPRLPVCCIRDLVGGFGSLAISAGGRVAIAQHLNEDGCDLRGYFHLEDVAGGSAFRGYLTPIVSPSYLFPQVAANPNGSFTLLGEVPRGGQYDETNDLRVSYLAAPGTFYTCFNWQMGAWTAIAPTTLFRDGRPAFPCIAASANGRVGVAVGDLGGNVYLIESSNGTFAPGTMTTRTLTNYSDGTVVQADSTSLEYRPYVHCHVAYNDTTPNVVWSEWQARKTGTTISYFDWRSRIRRWTPGRGVETVYQVPAGVADHYDDVDNGLAGPLPGFNTLSVDWPQVGFSPDGSETYVAFLAFTDAHVDPTADAGLPGVVTGIGYGDILCSVLRGGGAFAAPQNLTNTPDTDERFFSLATRNPGGRAQLLFQAASTNEAGCAIIGDRGTTPGNLLRRIAYLDAPLAASLLDAPPLAAPAAHALSVSPNPVLAHARIRIEAGVANGTRLIEVLDLTGRRLTTLVLAAGERAVEWRGVDDLGRRVPAGVYFARVAGEGTAHAARFVVAR
jgi:hypothetical protein